MQPTIPGMAQKAEKSEQDVQRLQEENADSKGGPWRAVHGKHEHSRIFLMSG